MKYETEFPSFLEQTCQESTRRGTVMWLLLGLLYRGDIAWAVNAPTPCSIQTSQCRGKVKRRNENTVPVGWGGPGAQLDTLPVCFFVEERAESPQWWSVVVSTGSMCDSCSPCKGWVASRGKNGETGLALGEGRDCQEKLELRKEKWILNLKGKLELRGWRRWEHTQKCPLEDAGHVQGLKTRMQRQNQGRWYAKSGSWERNEPWCVWQYGWLSNLTLCTAAHGVWFTKVQEQGNEPVAV